MTAVLPETFSVGPWTAGWVYAAEGAAIPFGVALDHGDHDLLVSWVAAAGGRFTVDSLVPLTVVEPVACVRCGETGRIEQGAWVPTAEGGGRGAR